MNKILGSVIGTGAVVLLGFGTSAAAAQAGPIKVTNSADARLDLTKDNPTLALDLLGDADVQWPLVLSVATSVPLGHGCDLYGSRPNKNGEPVDLNRSEATTVTFKTVDTPPTAGTAGDPAPVVASCDLTALSDETVSLQSPLVEGGVPFDVTIKTDAPLPVDRFTKALGEPIRWAIGLVALATIVGWIWWAFGWADRSRGRWGFLFTRMDGGKLTWSLSGSWLTNFTALGTAFAGAFALTDVLTSVGFKKPDLAAVALLNFGALALAATAPFAYLALRLYKNSTISKLTTSVTVRVKADKEGDDARKLTAEVPTITYAVDSANKLSDPTAGTVETFEWHQTGEHTALMKVPMRMGVHDVTLDGDGCCVGLHIPSAGDHDDPTTFLYDVEVPLLSSDDLTKANNTAGPAPKVKASTETSATYDARGTMAGFVAAAGLAAVAVTMQLTLFRQLTNQSTLSDDSQRFVNDGLNLATAFAMFYVFWTIVRRVFEADTATDGSENEPETSLVPMYPVKRPDATANTPAEVICEGADVEPVHPSVIIGREGIVIPARFNFSAVHDESLEIDLSTLRDPAPVYIAGPTKIRRRPVRRQQRGKDAESML